MSTTQYAWGDGIGHVGFSTQEVTLSTDEYELLIDTVFNKIKEDYKDDETCRFHCRLLGKLLILANQ